MANNYLQMSESYDLTPEQVAWFNKFFADCQRYAEGEDLDPDSPEGQRFLKMVDPLEDRNDLESLATAADSYFVLEKDGSLWVHDNDDGYTDVDVVCAVLETMLRETDDERVCTGTWASTCSKPRVGAFGGGWFAVSGKKGCMYGNAWDAAENAAQTLNGIENSKEVK